MTPTVVVADDDEDIRAVVRVTLELAGYTVLEASDGQAALDIARTQAPDAMLLDVMMPNMDGLQTLHAIRRDGRTSHIPVLLLTARTQTRDAVEGLHAGADDYVTKPFEPDELTARVHAAIRRADQQRARNPLTGLPGNERILLELTERVDSGEPTALLYIDVDAFKPFNDHYGFLRGDQALRSIGALLSDLAREFEDGVFVGHVGGDDFVVLTPPEVAEQAAQSICERVDLLAPTLYDPDDREAGSIEVPDRRGVVDRYSLLSVSIGIATTDRGTFAHHGEFVALATEMKRFAKSRRTEGSGYAIDRRDEAGRVELEAELP